MEKEDVESVSSETLEACFDGVDDVVVGDVDADGAVESCVGEDLAALGLKDNSVAEAWV